MQLNLEMEGAEGVGAELASSSEDGHIIMALRKMVKKEIDLMMAQQGNNLIRPIIVDFLGRVLNLQMGGVDYAGSELAGSSEDGQIVVDLRKIVKNEIELMMIRQGNEVLRPIMEDLVRNVVKQEIQLAVEKILAGGSRDKTNAAAMSYERSVHLKFLDEVPEYVLTGKEVKAKGGASMRVAIVDGDTKKVIESGPESSAKVEIFLLEATENDGPQDFNSRIIKGSDKAKPHFAKSYYIHLEKGIGELTNARLANDSNWTKSCKCRLGAQANVSGIKVQEAWTEPFAVSDSRSKLYEKHYPPSLSDEVWRLENIGKDGAPHKRLKKNKVQTVQHFLYLLSVDPQRLREVIGVRSNNVWNAIVEHARTCVVDDMRICVYNGSSESNMNVVFDVVGNLKGIIREFKFIRKNDLSIDEEDQAREFLRSAFDNRESITYYDETIFLQHFSCHDTEAPLNISMQEECPGCDANVPEDYWTLYLDWLANVPEDNWTSYLGRLSELGQYEPMTNLLDCQGSNPSVTPGNETQLRQQNNAGNILLLRIVAGFKLWMCRARKRIAALGQGDIHVSKRQRI